MLGIAPKLCRVRRSALIGNQRLMILYLAVAHNILCLINLIEFSIVAANLLGDFQSCFDIIRRRPVTSLCNLMVFCATLGCALDNYIAICHPFFHRTSSIRHHCYYSTILSITFVAILIALSDFLFVPAGVHSKDCTHLTIGNVSQNAIEVPIIISSSLNPDSMLEFCQNLYLCQSKIQEIAVAVFYLVCASGVSFCYVKTVAYIHRSLTSFQMRKPKLSSLDSWSVGNSTDPKLSFSENPKAQIDEIEAKQKVEQPLLQRKPSTAVCREESTGDESFALKSHKLLSLVEDGQKTEQQQQQQQQQLQHQTTNGSDCSRRHGNILTRNMSAIRRTVSTEFNERRRLSSMVMSIRRNTNTTNCSIARSAAENQRYRIMKARKRSM